MAKNRYTGHVEGCAVAVITPVEECKCPCEGAFHGGPHTERARALLRAEEDWATRDAYSRTQISRARGKYRNTAAQKRSSKGTDLLAALLIDGVVLSTEPDEAKRAEEGISLLVRPFVDEIANADLSTDERERIKAVLPDLHLLCTLCVAVLEVKRDLGAVLDDAADAVADSLVSRVMGAVSPTLTSVMIAAVLRIALKRAAQQFLEWAFEPVNETALQVICIVFCPNTEDHREVVELCIAPLEGEFLNSAIVEWAKMHYPLRADLFTPRSIAGLRHSPGPPERLGDTIRGDR